MHVFIVLCVYVNCVCTPALLNSTFVFICMTVSSISYSVQINLQAAKTNYERELATKEEQAEELRRNLTKQVRELESQLEDERKQRQTAQSAQKKIESELQDLENQLEAEAKGKEDAQRHYKKLHVREETLLECVFVNQCAIPGG